MGMIQCNKCHQSINIDHLPAGWAEVRIVTAGQLPGKSALLCGGCAVDLIRWIDPAWAERIGFIAPHASGQGSSPDYRQGVIDTFAALASFRDDGELRQMHDFARQRRHGDPFEPGRLILDWLSQPDPTPREVNELLLGQER